MVRPVFGLKFLIVWRQAFDDADEAKPDVRAILCEDRLDLLVDRIEPRGVLILVALLDRLIERRAGLPDDFDMIWSAV